MAATKKIKPAPPHPLAIIRRAVSEFGVDRAVVGVSCGKDSVVTLDLAKKHFREVRAYFMFLVPDLSFQTKYLAYLERRFDISIIRTPHWMLADLLRSGSFRLPTPQSRSITKKTRISDIEAYLRKQTGLSWFATGERCSDSIERNAMIRKAGGIDPVRRHIWPVAFWNDAAIFNYLKRENIALPPDYNNVLANGKNARAGSFGGLWAREVLWGREKYPDDYRKIVDMFPLIEAQAVRTLERERTK
jgi:phosphoadenosine phosphosulfate reductase